MRYYYALFEFNGSKQELMLHEHPVEFLIEYRGRYPRATIHLLFYHEVDAIVYNVGKRELG